MLNKTIYMCCGFQWISTEKGSRGCLCHADCLLRASFVLILIKFGRGAMNMYVRPEATVACIQRVRAPLINSHSRRLATVWLRAWQISGGTPFISTPQIEAVIQQLQITQFIWAPRRWQDKSSRFSRWRFSLRAAVTARTRNIRIIKTSLVV